MAAVGFGRYAAPEFDLGVQEDVRIPRAITPIEATFSDKELNAVEANINPPTSGDLRIIFQQHGQGGGIMRSWPGGPPNGKTVGTVLKIVAEQGGKTLPIEINYDKQVWSGLSWGAGEVKHAHFAAGAPIRVRCSSEKKSKVVLEGHVYSVGY
jgi:hypothetical protein